MFIISCILKILSVRISHSKGAYSWVISCSDSYLSYWRCCSATKALTNKKNPKFLISKGVLNQNFMISEKDYCRRIHRCRSADRNGRRAAKCYLHRIKLWVIYRPPRQIAPELGTSANTIVYWHPRFRFYTISSDFF